MRARTRHRTLVVYSLFVAVPVALSVVLLRASGAGHDRTVVASVVPKALADPFGAVLLAGAVVVGVGGIAGLICRAVGLAPVVGEMVAGIVVGPSVLGALWPDAEAAIFPSGVLPLLNIVAQVGVVFFMFLVGFELPLTMLARVGRSALQIGHATVAVPLLLGTLLALYLARNYQPVGVPGSSFVLFVGLAVSVTAFPVLARILADRNLVRTRIGTTGLTVAAVGDVTAWCALGVVVAGVGQHSAVGAMTSVAEVLGFVLVAWFGARPLMARLLRWAERTWSGNLPVGALVAAWVLGCSQVTNWMGVHAIFGAFVAGLVMPRSSRAVSDFAVKTEGLTVYLLLPIFFATVGLRTHLGDAFAGHAVVPLIAILAVAVVGKFGGTALAARVSGESWRSAAGLGAMMNCRGLTELVVLDVGLSLGVIGPDLFALLVVMTLVTTLMTDPLLRLLRVGDREDGAAEVRTTRPVPT